MVGWGGVIEREATPAAAACLTDAAGGKCVGGGQVLQGERLGRGAATLREGRVPPRLRGQRLSGRRRDVVRQRCGQERHVLRLRQQVRQRRTCRFVGSHGPLRHAHQCLHVVHVAVPQLGRQRLRNRHVAPLHTVHRRRHGSQHHRKWAGVGPVETGGRVVHAAAQQRQHVQRPHPVGRCRLAEHGDLCTEAGEMEGGGVRRAARGQGRADTVTHPLGDQCAPHIGGVGVGRLAGPRPEVHDPRRHVHLQQRRPGHLACMLAARVAGRSGCCKLASKRAAPPPPPPHLPPVGQT